MNRLKYCMAIFFALTMVFSLLSCGNIGGLDQDNDGAESNQLQSEEDCLNACPDKDGEREIRACQSSCSSKDRQEADRERDDECTQGDKVSREDTWYICKDGAWYAYDKEKDEDERCEPGDEVEKDGVTYLCDEERKWQ